MVPILRMADPMDSHRGPATSMEILIARAMAICVHPYAAWRTRSIKNRVLLIAGYVAVSYVAGLCWLFSAPTLFR